MSPFRTELSFQAFDMPTPTPAASEVSSQPAASSEDTVPRRWWSRPHGVRVSDSARNAASTRSLFASIQSRWPKADLKDPR